MKNSGLKVDEVLKKIDFNDFGPFSILGLNIDVDTTTRNLQNVVTSKMIK